MSREGLLVRIDPRFEPVDLGLKEIFAIVTVHMVEYSLFHFELRLVLLEALLWFVATILRLVQQLTLLLVSQRQLSKFQILLFEVSESQEMHIHLKD